MARATQGSNNVWVIWLSLLVGLVLAVAPMPTFTEIGRPLWLAMLLTYWVLLLPERVGMVTAWLLGLAQDVLYGNLLGQNALILGLITFLVLSLHQRLRMFPAWQQCLVLVVVYGLAQLLQLWLNALTGNRPPTLTFLLPALVSALLWPWVYALLQFVRLRLNVREVRFAAMLRRIRHSSKRVIGASPDAFPGSLHAVAVSRLRLAPSP